MLETLFKRAAGRQAPARRRSRHACGLRAARRLIAAGVLAALSAAPASADPAHAPRELAIADYRSYLADGHPVRQGMRKFAELVRVGSGGSLRIEPRTDALPGSPAQQIAALRAGAADAPALMLVAGTGLAAQDRAFALLDLPYLVRDERQADVLLDGPFGDALLARVGGGLVGLGWWENGFRQITSAAGPIRRAEDLRGLKLRVIGEPVFVETAQAMGATAVPLPFGELHAALKDGRAEAQDNFLSQILAGRLHEVQSALAITNHSYSPLVLVANARAWDALTAQQQRLLREAAVQAGRFQRTLVRAEAHAARAELRAHGMAVTELDPVESRKLQALTASLRERYFRPHADTLLPLYRHEEGAMAR